MSDLILIVDDEPELVQALEFSFQREGFRTLAAHTGLDALAMARSEPPPDLVLLDLMLPDIPGTEVCRRLRADGRTATISVIMVTARGEPTDRVVGLELGADDYVVKPFHTRELILRVRAVLRRTRATPSEAPVETWGNLRLSRDAHQVWVDGEAVALSALEFRLLLTLIDRRGRVQSREQLLDAAWDEPYAVDPRTVDTVVKRTRQKLGAAGQLIKTVRGVGYRFALE